MKFDDFLPQDHLAPEKVSICGSAVAMTTVTVLEGYIDTLLREFPTKAIEKLFSLIQRKTRIAVLE
ncbi:MAG: hypothetical protein RMX68_008835 [Aulosira sp. ZfuVER01]|nr:hypothetical protein [Aulosira sp. ZfuVER01]MDZ7998660.1 hypothetical protein [Aulosira sp. DedVER01a]MDZ8054832.1 hypothetical protein [Aulosira sp. ZfuCHP01]